MSSSLSASKSSFYYNVVLAALDDIEGSQERAHLDNRTRTISGFFIPSGLLLETANQQQTADSGLRAKFEYETRVVQGRLYLDTLVKNALVHLQSKGILTVTHWHFHNWKQAFQKSPSLVKKLLFKSVIISVDYHHMEPEEQTVIMGRLEPNFCYAVLAGIRARLGQFPSRSGVYELLKLVIEESVKKHGGTQLRPEKFLLGEQQAAGIASNATGSLAASQTTPAIKAHDKGAQNRKRKRSHLQHLAGTNSINVGHDTVDGLGYRSSTANRTAPKKQKMMEKENVHLGEGRPTNKSYATTWNPPSRINN